MPIYNDNIIKKLVKFVKFSYINYLRKLQSKTPVIDNIFIKKIKIK